MQVMRWRKVAGHLTRGFTAARLSESSLFRSLAPLWELSPINDKVSKHGRHLEAGRTTPPFRRLNIALAT